MAMADRARELAEALGLAGRHVFFNEAWVPYEHRADFLLDADLGVSCHFDHVETEFSFRTRILDYLWAGLPIVCSSGDAFGDLVEHERLGSAVPPEDGIALADAITRLLTDDAERAATSGRVRVVAARFTWAKSLEPLTRFARNPRRAPDIAEELGPARLGVARSEPKRKAFDVRADVRLARQYLDDGGLTELLRRARGRVRRVASDGVEP
jgi:hypothetical protein